MKKKEPLVALTTFPHWLPMQATEASSPFSQQEWWYEVLWSGHRALAEVASRQVRLVDEHGSHWELDCPHIVADLRGMSSLAVLDGMILSFDEKGRVAPQQLEDHIDEANTENRLVYAAFDCLLLDGESLICLPLVERKRRLAGALPQSPHLLFSEHIVGDGAAVLDWACRRGTRGVIAKDPNSPYRPGETSEAWLTIHQTATRPLSYPYPSEKAYRAASSIR